MGPDPGLAVGTEHLCPWCETNQGRPGQDLLLLTLTAGGTALVEDIAPDSHCEHRGACDLSPNLWGESFRETVSKERPEGRAQV